MRSATTCVPIITYNWHVDSDDCGWNLVQHSLESYDDVVIEGFSLSATTTVNANLRQSPVWLRETILHTIPNGTSIMLIGRESQALPSWFVVEWEGQSVWIHRDTLRLEGPVLHLPIRQG